MTIARKSTRGATSNTTGREQARLGELRALGILDTEPEPIFDDLVVLAARIARVPIALVSLVDAQRQWFKARVGLDVCSTGRDVAFCDYVVRSEQEMEVEDARLDPRFRDNPLVTGGPRIVFYAGFPLLAREGLAIGTLCVIGLEPGALDDEQRHGLRTLAQLAMTQLELRRSAAELAEQLARRREAEVQLVGSRREYALFAEHSTDIISRHRPDGHVTYVSPAVRTVLGYDPARELAENAQGHVHPEDRPLLVEALGSLAGGTTSTVTVRAQHADGSWRWMEITLSPLFDEQGRLVEVYSAARDVTERVLATEALARKNEFVRAVLDSVAVGIVACDGEGRLTLFNHATRDFHGIAADASIPAEQWSRHFDLFRPDAVTPLQPDEVPLYRALTLGSVDDAEIVIAPHGLPTRLVRCDGQALRDEDGTTIGAVLAMTDITATRAAERALREAHDQLSRSSQALTRSEAQFRSAFENGPMAMCRLDPAGRVVQANPAMRRLLATTSEALFEAKLTRFAVSGDRPRLALILAGASSLRAEPEYVEVRMRRADGSSIWCEIAVSAAPDNDGQHYLLVQIADIDSRKQRESELERAAARDALTGLANRVALDHRLSELLAEGAPDRPTAVLFVDLDGFKGVNDSCGHAAGDAVLVEVARRLSGLVRPEDVVARHGGDEFVIVRHDRDGKGAERCTELVDRVRAAIAQPFDTTQGSHRLGISVGLVLAHRGDDPAAVLAKADAAMYDDKRRVRDVARSC